VDRVFACVLQARTQLNDYVTRSHLRYREVATGAPEKLALRSQMLPAGEMTSAHLSPYQPTMVVKSTPCMSCRLPNREGLRSAFEAICPWQIVWVEILCEVSVALRALNRLKVLVVEVQNRWQCARPALHETMFIGSTRINLIAPPLLRIDTTILYPPHLCCAFVEGKGVCGCLIG
jgi:hypothetical protein